MDYNQFKKELIDFITNTYYERFSMPLSVSVIEKKEEELLVMQAKGGESLVFSIPLSSLYDSYMESSNLAAIGVLCLLKFLDFESGSNIVQVACREESTSEYSDIPYRFTLMGASEDARGMLKIMPHRKFFDFALGYCMIVNKGGEVVTGLVSELNFEHTEQIEHSLYELSVIKMQETFSLVDELDGILLMWNANDILSVSKDVVRTLKHLSEKYVLYYLHNSECAAGASGLVFGHAFESLSYDLEDDLLIMPLNSHSLIVAPVSGGISAGEMMSVLTFANQTYEEPMSILSYNIYRYCRKEQKVTVELGPRISIRKEELYMTDPYYPVYKVDDLEILNGGAVERLMSNNGLAGYFLIFPDGKKEVVQDGYDEAFVRSCIMRGALIGVI